MGVLVVDWNPLTVYIWKQPYMRFAGEKYDHELKDYSELMHLVNNSVVKNAKDFSDYNDDLETEGYMWFYQRYQKWLHDTHCRNNVHNTSFCHDPPFTCETFGVKWENVRFTMPAEEDDEEVDSETGGTPKAKTAGGLKSPLKSALSPKKNRLKKNAEEKK